MRLTFSILWFDDNESWLDSLDLSALESEIQQWGFIPEIIKVSSDEDFNNYASSKRFDLIIVDYYLEGYGNGQEFIETLRKKLIFTEIIFYSTGEIKNLWDAVRDKQLEGVYIESRRTVVNFTKIIQVGQQIVHKVVDLANMRGIVMAEVGDLDLLLTEILTKGIPALPDSKKTIFFRDFLKGIDEQIAGQNEKLHSFRNDPTLEGFLDLCDSNKLWAGLHRLIKHHTSLKGSAKKEAYYKEILFPRNCLGHGIPFEKDGYHIFKHKDKEYLFNNDIGRELRQKIVEYKNFLNEISGKL